MEKSLPLIKSMLPSLVKQVSDWFEIDLVIKLFGVRVFSFTWPPKSEQNVES